MNIRNRLQQFLREVIKKDPEVIVTGNQKSGTTAIAKLLGFATNKTVQNDIPLFWPPEIYQYLNGKKSIEDFIKKNRKYFSSEIVKEPNLTFFLVDLFRIIPDARYVFVVRDPRDNIRSILNRRGVPGDLDQLDNDRFNIDPARTYLGNSCQWNYEDGHYISQQAMKWQACLDCYKAARNQVQLIKYEDFNANKIDVITKLTEQLGLSSVKSIDHLKDISFQPKGNSSMPWLSFFGKKNLTRIEKICRDSMIEFGYPPTQ